MSVAPIGRREDFDAVKTRLEGPKPGLIVIAGPAGSGRTYLLRHLAVAAQELGYRVLLGTDADPVEIEPSTTVADILRRLQDLLDDGGHLENALRPIAPSSILKSAVKNNDVAALFGLMAPLFVAVDGYRPSSGLESWITGAIIPRLRASEDRIAVVVSDRTDSLRSMIDTADLSIILGQLDTNEVRAHLRQVAAGFSPELTSEELDRYTEKAIDQPALLSALSAVFGAYTSRRTEVSR